jgi:hypothetical protein
MDIGTRASLRRLAVDFVQWTSGCDLCFAGMLFGNSIRVTHGLLFKSGDKQIVIHTLPGWLFGRVIRSPDT